MRIRGRDVIQVVGSNLLLGCMLRVLNMEDRQKIRDDVQPINYRLRDGPNVKGF
jgi:hypothetical protein